MAIRLQYDEDFSNGLKRLILDECELALDSLRMANNTERSHEAVHEVRKAFKKIRACLRLIRDKIDYYKEGNIFFRDLGRSISDIRDATARLESLELLKMQYGDKIYKNAFDHLESRLLEYREKMAKKAFEKQNILEELEKKLASKMTEINEWKVEVNGFEDIRPSLRRVYKRGRKMFDKARDSKKMEDYHEWRKRAKYLRYQIDVLNRLWPRVMAVMEKELHDLTDYIGALHDLHMLRSWTGKRASLFKDKEERALLFAILDKQRELMRVNADLKGAKFYYLDPDRFCDKIENYWQVYEKERKKLLGVKKTELEK